MLGSLHCPTSELPGALRTEAADQLEELHAFISRAAKSAIASDYLDAIVGYCEGLAVFPIRGTPREDIRPGLRTVAYTKRVVIAFAVDEHAKRITILGIFYGGQDYESALIDPDDKP
ncbi:MAG TPA: type II toxin-antitoxin system RelE/ParE family toxin [Dermatophilaceae bacterium]|nr:type II toxin-antitoxin system RelE/ParE family toxin [Dermatophilaceae bacterium]